MTCLADQGISGAAGVFRRGRHFLALLSTLCLFVVG
jgi:hypothetical protein